MWNKLQVLIEILNDLEFQLKTNGCDCNTKRTFLTFLKGGSSYIPKHFKIDDEEVIYDFIGNTALQP